MSIRAASRACLALRSVGHFRLTNKTPAATYRAPGRYETTFVHERLVEAIAHALKLDPVKVRRRYTISAAEMPFHRPLEVLGEKVRHDTGDYMGLLDKLLARASWPKLTADLARRRHDGELVGAGIAMYVEKSGLGPSDYVKIAVDTSGRVEVVAGGASMGQGFETVVAQVAAETIGSLLGVVAALFGRLHDAVADRGEEPFQKPWHAFSFMARNVCMAFSLDCTRRTAPWSD